MRRLKTHSQFRAVLAGPRMASTAHFVLHRCELERAGLRAAHAVVKDDDAPTTTAAVPAIPVMGAMVPKRWAKRAVTRNMVKRQIYTLGAVALSVLSPAAYVVRMRSGFDRARFVSATSAALKSAVREELMALFSQAQVAAAGVGQASARQP